MVLYSKVHHVCFVVVCVRYVCVCVFPVMSLSAGGVVPICVDGCNVVEPESNFPMGTIKKERKKEKKKRKKKERKYLSMSSS